MADNFSNGLLPRTNLLSFQAIGLEVRQRLVHLFQASLAGNLLLLPYYNWIERRKQFTADSRLTEVIEPWRQLDEEAAHLFGLEWRRSLVVAGMAVLESFFKGMTRFGRRVLPESAGRTRTGASSREKKRSGDVYGQQFEKLKTLYGVPLVSAEALLQGIESIARLRNEIAHDASLYELREATTAGEFYADAKPLPEADHRQAMEALMQVAEFTDAVFVEIFQHLFGREPEVRPLPAEVSAVHRQLRQAWQAADATPPEVEQVAEAGWAARKHPGEGENRFSVAMSQWRVWVTPTGIASVPALFSVLAHKAHGRRARWRVDAGDWLDMEGKPAIDLLAALLQGQELVIEYFRRAGEKPSYLATSLAGFRAAWDECNEKMNQGHSTSAEHDL